MTPGARLPPASPRATPAPVVPSPAIERFEREVRDLPRERRDARVDDFWRAHPAAPLIETPSADGDGGAADPLVTFLWRDAGADEVLLFVNRLTDPHRPDDSLMRRVPGTDVWHLTYRMAPDWRASYAFLPRPSGERRTWVAGDRMGFRRALGDARVDPRGRESVRDAVGRERSVVSLPRAPAQPWLTRRDGVARGVTTRLDGPDGRRVWVHEPAAPEGRLPIVVALDGDVWTGAHDLATTVDNLVDDAVVRPPLLVMLDSGGRERRRDLDAASLADWLADRLLPWVRDRWSSGESAAEVVVVGQSLGGLAALEAALRRPDAIGGVLSQSASLWRADLAELAGLAAATAPARLRCYVEVGTQEWLLREPNERLARALAAAGADVRYVEYNGGHDYACWRGGVADGLRHLLPAGERPGGRGSDRAAASARD